MTAEQLTLDLGVLPESTRPARSLTVAIDGRCPHFRNHIARAPDWERAAAYEAADRAWRAAPVSQNPSMLVSEIQAREPEATAADLRLRVGVMDDEPILNMVELLKSVGCVVAAMPGEVNEVSAFSGWFDDTPLVLLKSSGAARRRVRFDAAHELGHLLLHRGQGPSRSAEREANKFSASLLLPPAALADINLRPFSWDPVLDAANRLDVNRLPVLRRAVDLGHISQPVYHAAMLDAVRRGWKSQDPADVLEPERIPSCTDTLPQS